MATYVVDEQLDKGMVGRADAVGGQLDHLGAAGVGGGALGGGGQLALLAPAGDHQVAEVEVEQPVGDDGDLVAGGFAAGRTQAPARAHGAEDAMLVEGLGQGLFGVLVLAEQEGRIR